MSSSFNACDEVDEPGFSTEIDDAKYPKITFTISVSSDSRLKFVQIMVWGCSYSIRYHIAKCQIFNTAT